jgi:thiamine biosynthesis protein ThiS
MRILLNGQQREIPDGLTISGLIIHLELAGERIAVERNGEIVRRAEWDRTRLQEGDRLEIVHFVGGGYDGGCATAPSFRPVRQKAAAARRMSPVDRQDVTDSLKGGSPLT